MYSTFISRVCLSLIGLIDTKSARDISLVTDLFCVYDGPEWEGEDRRICEAWVQMRLILFVGLYNVSVIHWSRPPSSHL